MKKKLLSIGIPVYNTEKYLDRCLGSVLSENTVIQIEIIAVNDGSTDGSLRVLQRWQKQFPQVIRIIDQENGGPGSAINSAVKMATGEYFKLLDSDDWFDPVNFPLYLEALKETTADVVINRMVGEHTYKNWQDFDEMYCGVHYGEVIRFEDVILDRILPMAGIAYKTSLLQHNYREIAEHCLYVDNEFIVYPMINMNTLLFLDIILYHYFIGRPEQSVNIRNKIRNYSHLQCISYRLLKYWETVKFELPVNKRIYLGDFIYKVVQGYIELILNNRMGIKNKDKEKLIREIIKQIKVADPIFLERLSKNHLYRVFCIFPALSLFLFPLLKQMYRHKKY